MQDQIDLNELRKQIDYEKMEELQTKQGPLSDRDLILLSQLKEAGHTLDRIEGFLNHFKLVIDRINRVDED